MGKKEKEEVEKVIGESMTLKCTKLHRAKQTEQDKEQVVCESGSLLS